MNSTKIDSKTSKFYHDWLKESQTHLSLPCCRRKPVLSSCHNRGNGLISTGVKTCRGNIHYDMSNVTYHYPISLSSHYVKCPFIILGSFFILLKEKIKVDGRNYLIIMRWKWDRSPVCKIFP